MKYDERVWKLFKTLDDCPHAVDYSSLVVITVAWKIGVMTNTALVSANSRSPQESFHASHPLHNYIYTRESSIFSTLTKTS